jgi:CheY-like chemotaxis protein
MQLMRGSIGVESVPGSCTAFWVELETCDGDDARIRPHTESRTPSGRSAGAPVATILYIEDNPANLRLVEQVIRQRTPYSLIDAPTAELGLQLARIRQPDVILMDINLPGMDGYQALGELKTLEATRQIPVIAISANAMREDVARGRDAAFDGYLTKPIDIDRLLDSLRTAVVSRQVPEIAATLDIIKDT